MVKSSFSEAMLPPVEPGSAFDDEVEELDLWDRIHEKLFFIFAKTKVGLYCDLVQTALSFVTLSDLGTSSQILPNGFR